VKLWPEQLAAQLRKGLAPLYLIHGDEPLLVQENADAVRTAARAQGYSERECLTVEPGFDWRGLMQTAATASLFAARRLLELRLNAAKPDSTGTDVLKTYAQRPPADTLLLITAAKLDKNAQKSAWVGALEKAGVVVPILPVDRRQLPAWIERRLLGKGLRPTPAAVALLAERVEGNLLAAAQEIEKLYLLFGNGPVSVEQVLGVVGDSARYNVFDLVDAAMSGQIERVARIIDGLRGEGVEPTLIVWALHREIQTLTGIIFALQQGTNLENALNQYKIWEKRKPLLRWALGRLSSANCRRLLNYCARADQVVKGARPGAPWDELLHLALALAGQETLARADKQRLWV